MVDRTATIQEFLAATAARTPTPGGGAVAALTGAAASALGEMVLNYSVGKKELAAHEAELKAAVVEMQRARAMFLEFMAEDQSAYEELSAAKKSAEGSQRRAALKRCIDIPQAVAAAALAVLQLADQVSPRVNKYLLSDLAIAADLAMATVRCSVQNVRVNLSELDMAAEREKIEQASQQTLDRALAAIIHFSRRTL